MMGVMQYANWAIPIYCPWCGEYQEIYDSNVSMTVEGYDICRNSKDGVETIECEYCEKEIEITAQLDVGVCKKGE